MTERTTYVPTTNFMNDGNYVAPVAKAAEEQPTAVPVRKKSKKELRVESREKLAKEQIKREDARAERANRKSVFDDAFYSTKNDYWEKTKEFPSKFLQDHGTKLWIAAGCVAVGVLFGGGPLMATAVQTAAGWLAPAATTLGNAAASVGITNWFQTSCAVAGLWLGKGIWNSVFEGRDAVIAQQNEEETVAQIKERMLAERSGSASSNSQEREERETVTSEALNDPMAIIQQLSQQLEELREELRQAQAGNPLTNGNAPYAYNDNPTNQVINIETATANAPHGMLAVHLAVNEPVDDVSGRSYSLVHGDKSVNFVRACSENHVMRQKTAAAWDITRYGPYATPEGIAGLATANDLRFRTKAIDAVAFNLYKGVITGRDYANSVEKGVNLQVTDEQAEKWAKLAVLGEALSEALPALAGEEGTCLFVGTAGIKIDKSFKEICKKYGWYATPETAKEAIDMYEVLKREKEVRFTQATEWKQHKGR
jgi:hypothetical protein